MEEDELVEECFLEDGFLLLLPPKNFMWGRCGLRKAAVERLVWSPETRLCGILSQCPKRVARRDSGGWPSALCGGGG